MGQKRMNSLIILATFKSLVDNLSLVEVAEEFTTNVTSRRTHFERFSDTDLL